MSPGIFTFFKFLLLIFFFSLLHFIKSLYTSCVADQRVVAEYHYPGVVGDGDVGSVQCAGIQRWAESGGAEKGRTS